ncbi:MAG: ATP-binding protein [Oscillospiraceae bacterium]|nr:ATP-binding protein [Oscillospiraceae bacterium]
MGVPADAIRRVSICLYEGEINMVIHANGGDIDVLVYPDRIEMILKDTGKGIANIEQAMQAGWSTATEKVHSLGFGAGMGLPNMKTNSDEMKIDSTVGVGTTVYMTVKF